MRQFLNFNFLNSETVKSFYKEFTGLFSKPFSGERTNLISLDIGTSSVKLVELGRKHNQIILENFMIAPLPEGAVVGHKIENYSFLTDTLKEIVAKNNYAGRDTAVVLSGPQVVMQILKVPNGLADHQLATHVELEAEKYLPFSTEEVALDFDVLDAGKKSLSNASITSIPGAAMPNLTNPKVHTEVLLAATKKTLIDEYITILKAADLNIKVMDIYSCVIGRLSTHIVSKQLQSDVSDKVIAMVDIGHEILTVTIFKNEKQIYIKEQNFGGKLLNELIQKEHSVDYKLAENLKFKHEDSAIAAIIENFNTQVTMQIYHMIQFFYASIASEKINYIYLFGGCAKLPGLVKSINQKMEIDVDILKPFININIEKFAKDKKLQDYDTTLATACGLALRSYVG
ncbi:MAG: type IV pilus assembly protein PilM [Gammaproteobacteria bacterium]|nr:type IV pilus assembly protein PilM [Gammaproteobacteria bacterium]